MGQDLIDEWKQLPWDEAGLKEVPGFKNHAADQALYGWRATTAYHNQAPAAGPKRGSKEAYEEEARRLEQLAVEECERTEREERQETW